MVRKIKNRKTITVQEILELEQEGFLNNYDEDSPFESFEEMQSFRERKLKL